MSLPLNGEISWRDTLGPTRLRGSVQKPGRERWGGWRRNGDDGVTQDAGRPARERTVFMLDREPKSRLCRKQSAHSSDEAP
jgi:hypothetical protein